MCERNCVELPSKDTEVPTEFLLSWNSAQTLFLKKEGRVSWGMKPNILRYFSMRVLFHSARNSGHTRQKECILTWGHNSCNHKHSHSHFAHNPFFFKVSVHAWNSWHVCTFHIQHTSYTSVGLGITTTCASISKHWKHTLCSQWLGAPSMSNTIKSHCRDRINTAVYW